MRRSRLVRIAGQTQGEIEIKRVLFVCVENANRSQMTEGFARLHGGGGLEVSSAGSRPRGSLNPKAIRFMAERGIDLTTHDSKSLDDVNGEFDAVITMGCGDDCPWLPAKRREDWALPDPRDMDDDGYRRVRDEIEMRALALLQSLGVKARLKWRAAFAEMSVASLLAVREKTT